jgi:hypothetical protein
MGPPLQLVSNMFAYNYIWCYRGVRLEGLS